MKIKLFFTAFVILVALFTAQLFGANVNEPDDFYCTGGCIGDPIIVLTAGEIKLGGTATFVAKLQWNKATFHDCDGNVLADKCDGQPTVELGAPQYFAAGDFVPGEEKEMKDNGDGTFGCGEVPDSSDDNACKGIEVTSAPVTITFNQPGYYVIDADPTGIDCQAKKNNCYAEVSNCYNTPNKIYCYIKIEDDGGPECVAKSFKTLIFEHEDAPYEEGGKEEWSSVIVEFSSEEEDDNQCSYRVIAPYNTFISPTTQICDIECEDEVTTLDTVRAHGVYNKTILDSCGDKYTSGFYVVSHLDAHGTDGGTTDDMVDYTEALPKRLGTVYDPVIQMNSGGDQSVHGCSLYGYINCDAYNAWSLTAVARDPENPELNIPPGYTVKWSGVPITAEQSDDESISFVIETPGRFIPRLEVWYTDPDEEGASPELVGEAEIHSIVVEQNQGDNVIMAPDYLEDPDDARGCKFHVTNKAGGFTVDAKIFIEGLSDARGRVSTDGYPQNEYWVTDEDLGDLPQVDRVEDGAAKVYFLQGYGDPSTSKNDLELKLEGQAFREKCDECPWWLEEDNLVEVEWMPTDEEPFTSIILDVDVDSDNNDADGKPQRNIEEDSIEDLGDNYGKYIAAPIDDYDLDGIPDFADGYDRDEDVSNDDASLSAGGDYVRIWPELVIELPRYVDRNKLTIELFYSYSDIDEVERKTDDSVPKYIAGENPIRLWAKKHSDERNSDSWDKGGDLVPPGEYDVTDVFGDGESQVTLYVEPIQPTDDEEDLDIKVELRDSESGCLLGRDVVRVNVFQIIPEWMMKDSEGNVRVTDTNLQIDRPEPAVSMTVESVSTRSDGGVDIEVSGHVYDGYSEHVEDANGVISGVGIYIESTLIETVPAVIEELNDPWKAREVDFDFNYTISLDEMPQSSFNIYARVENQAGGFGESRIGIPVYKEFNGARGMSVNNDVSLSPTIYIEFDESSDIQGLFFSVNGNQYRELVNNNGVYQLIWGDKKILLTILGIESADSDSDFSRLSAEIKLVSVDGSSSPESSSVFLWTENALDSNVYVVTQKHADLSVSVNGVESATLYYGNEVGKKQFIELNYESGSWNYSSTSKYLNLIDVDCTFMLGDDPANLSNSINASLSFSLAESSTLIPGYAGVWHLRPDGDYWLYLNQALSGELSGNLSFERKIGDPIKFHDTEGSRINSYIPRMRYLGLEPKEEDLPKVNLGGDMLEAVELEGGL